MTSLDRLWQSFMTSRFGAKAERTERR